jgi:hypothetical protein
MAAMKVLRGIVGSGLVLVLAACGSDDVPVPTAPPQIDAATSTDLGACVVDRMQGGTGIDRVQVFEVGYNTALNLFLGGPVPAEPPGDPNYLLWVTGAEPPDDGIVVLDGPAQPSGATLGVWMIEPVARGPVAAGESLCQGDDWGDVRESQGPPALDKLGASVDLPQADYDIPGPPTS